MYIYEYIIWLVSHPQYTKHDSLGHHSSLFLDFTIIGKYRFSYNCFEELDSQQCFQGYVFFSIWNILHCSNSAILGKTSIEKKKTFSFGHCPNYLTPPPPWPQFGQLGPLFSEVKIQDLKFSLELRIIYILYNILYICNLKNS